MNNNMYLLRNYVLSLCLLLSLNSIYAQLPPVDVAELTLKVAGFQTEEVFYGFAEGDQIVFSFEEVKGKLVKEIEIVELPTQSKFSDFKTSSITEKKITVYKKGVYKFIFKNSAVAPRICKVKIQRIPKSEDLNGFNTNWEWQEIYDTTYIPYTEDSLVGYDTLHYKEEVKELVENKKVEELVFDKTQRVHSYWNPNPSRTYLQIKLPPNKVAPYRQEKIVAWAYWIGVGEESKEAWDKNVRAIGNSAANVVSAVGSPLAGFAVGSITTLAIPTVGDDVSYYFVQNYVNVQAFMNKQTFYQFDQGKGIAAYGKNTQNLQGNFYICMHNDNDRRGIDVNVKIVAIKEIKVYEDKVYDRQKITPQYVQLNKQRMEVKSAKIRVNAK